ncbi:MAG TPA: hypothetical protein PLG04_04160 [Anaerolineaceae bacterium]|nr:hypothetical protein [Bacteroidota bacterium]HOR77987.1 hypothetical protein [Anaerolineaceae bacterium]HQK34267.1 hypothetical protein [Spirochaetales bacterium]
MKRFLPMLLLLGAFACSTVRQLPSTDSTKVEVRTETVTVHDTAYVELPVIIEKVATLDTTSTLENKFARSEASVSAGILSHTLETKPVQLPVQVETKIVYKDSLVYRDRVQTQTVEVEKKLTAWQQAKMKLGSVALLLIGLAIIYLIYLIVKRF